MTPKHFNYYILNKGLSLIILLCILNKSSWAQIGNTEPSHSENGIEHITNTMRYLRAICSRNVPPEVKKLRLSQLAILLKHNSLYVRRCAANQIAQANTKDAIDMLIQALEDSDTHVRINAINGLKKYDEPKAFKSLAFALEDEEMHVRAHIALNLYHFILLNPKRLKQFKSAIKDLNFFDKFLKEKNVKVKQLISKVIARFNGPFKALKHYDEDVRQAAVEEFSFAFNQGPASTGALINALEDPSHKVRENAAIILSQTKNIKAKQVLTELAKELKMSFELAQSLASKGIVNKNIIERLILSLTQDTLDRRLKAVKVLSIIKSTRAVDGLITAAKDNNVRVRRSALYALSQVDDPRKTINLISALKDYDRRVKTIATRQLGRLKVSQAIIPLISALSDTDYTIRKEIILSLSKIGGSEAIAAIRSISSHDENTYLRELARKILHRLDRQEKERRKADQYIADLSSENTDIRVKAAFSLSILKPPKALYPLIKALKDKEVRVRINAAYALGKLKDKTAIEPLLLTINDKEPEVRRSAIYALGNLWVTVNKAEKHLIFALHDQNIEVRKAAAIVISTGKVLDPKVIKIADVLIKALNNQHNSVKVFIVTALGKYIDPKAIDPLVTIINNKNESRYTRLKAMTSLNKIKNPRQTKALIALLNNEEVYVSRMAYKFLKKVKDPSVQKAVQDFEKKH